METVDVSVLKELMKTNVIEFTYVKVNGDIRNAHGTLDANYIRERGGEPDGKRNFKTPDNQFRYWDVNSDGWRSCRSNYIQSYKEPDAIQSKLDM